MNHAKYCGKFIPQGGSVLDVGASRGKFLLEMARAGFKTYGVEINPDYISDAKKTDPGLNIAEASAEKLPFQSGFFDFVNCAEVTEHVDDPLKVCREIFRVLKPGGRCYISFHNRWGIYDYHYNLYFINWMPRFLAERILGLLGRKKDDGPAGRQKLATMHYYTYVHAKKLLSTAGFAAEDIRTEKIRKIFGVFGPPTLFFYMLFLRPFYFNTFHFLAVKPKI